MTTTLLIDGDITLYQVASAIEEPIHWGNDFWTLHADAKAAYQSFDYEINKIIKRLGCVESAEIIIAFSDPTKNWRMGVLPSYKHNRKNKRKPVIYVALREYAKANYITAEYPSLEADDVLGILSGDDKIIVSDDKDLRTIPGQLYSPMKDDHIEITEIEADRNHLIQTLTGDSVDGYPGCPGIGPKRAEAVLKNSTWSEVLEAYIKAGLNEQAALQQARVAKILRKEDWDDKNKEVILWNPK